MFHPDNLATTVEELTGAQDSVAIAPNVANAKARKADAERRLRKLHDAIAAGVDPTALVEPINQAQADRVNAQAEIDNHRDGDQLDLAEVHAMIDSLGDIARTLDERKPPALNRLYRALDLNMVYNAEEQAIVVTACPRVASERVRGGT